MKIISDVMGTAEESRLYDDGATVTDLIRRANVSHGRIVKILGVLTSHGLMEQVDSDGAKKYRISTTGKQFLNEYHTFMKFSENFGLSI